MPLGAHKAAMMGTAGVSTADVVLLQTLNADESANLSFTSGIDSTYGEYIFAFYNFHGSDDESPTFHVSIDGGSNYNVTHTSVTAYTYQYESNSSQNFSHLSAVQQATGFVTLQSTTGGATAADNSSTGYVHLFNPSSTTYVKHFLCFGTGQHPNGSFNSLYGGGYFNTTDNIDAVQFKMGTGNIDTGRVKMWGVK